MRYYNVIHSYLVRCDLCLPTLVCYGALNCANVITAVAILMTGDVAITAAE